MGVENYLIADSVVGVIAQRLVRPGLSGMRNCPGGNRRGEKDTRHKGSYQTDQCPHTGAQRMCPLRRNRILWKNRYL